jgi:nucleoside-diphosphate-sugar epimerase
MAHYLVTGGAGFIGSHMVEELVRRGHRVRVVDSLVTGHRANLQAVADRIEFVEADLADTGVAESAVQGVDVVLHQAAIPSVPRSVEEPLPCHRSNIEATLNTLVAARNAGVQRLVFAGSSSVYGNATVMPIREDARLHPLSPYALHKLTGEQYGRLFTELYGFPVVTTRYFNVFGPRQDPSSPYSGVISIFLRAVTEGRAPTIYGDGGQTRDYTYVADVVEGVLRACEAPKAAGRIINLATGRSTSLNELYRALQALTGSAVPASYGPSRVGDVRDSQADVTLASELLEFSSSVSLEEGLRRTLAWMRTSSAA